MEVHRYMTRNPVCVGPRDSIRKARLLLCEGHLRRLPVVEDGRVIGIVTDRDIAARSPTGTLEGCTTDGQELADHLRIMGIMTLHPVTVAPTSSVLEAARHLRASRVGALLVVEDGSLVGIITKGDLIDALLDGCAPPAVNAT